MIGLTASMIGLIKLLNPSTLYSSDYTKPGTVMYLCAMGIDLTQIYDLSIGF